MTTTPQAIRENQRDLIVALTPTELADYTFVEHIEKIPFADWVEKNASTCLRVFSIEDLSPYATPLGSDHVSEEIETQFEVSVSYPVSYTYGSDGANGLADVVEQDRLLIERAIGIYGSANYVAGQQVGRLSGFTIDRAAMAWIASATYDINFRRAV